MHWKTHIVERARTIADSFKDHPQVIAIGIGGSIGRGMTWKHSDVELCLVVDSAIKDLPYFNYIEDIGVEIIQITAERMNGFVNGFDAPNESILRFPIQIYKCRIIHDPTGLLRRFKDIYDHHLFHESIIRLKEDDALKQADSRLMKAKQLVSSGRIHTALGHLRLGLNDLLLAYHWRFGMLPRSQNRTIPLLKKHSKIFGEDLYQAFYYSYGLDKPVKNLRDRLFKAKPDIHSLFSNNWGESSVSFLQKAVDGNLEWGIPRSIIYVNKYCIHLLQCSNIEHDRIYDEKTFAEQHRHLHTFLDFDYVDREHVEHAVRLFEAAREGLDAKMK